MGIANRICACLWRIASIYLAAYSSLGGARRHWPAHRRGPSQFLADLDCWCDWSCPWGLVLILGGHESRNTDHSHLAAVAAARIAAERRSVRTALGFACYLRRSLLRTVASLGPTCRRNFPHALLALLDCKFFFRFCLSGPAVGFCRCRGYGG